MSGSPDAEIVARVHAANAQVHDAYAPAHDSVVPYIRRKSTRRYYEGLIAQGLARAGQKLEGSAVLELGCGTGTFTKFALDAGAASFTGLDLSPGMLEVARRKFSDPRARFVCAPLEEFAPSAQAGYDVILSSSFLHHLVDLRAGLEAIESMLRPGGVYVALHELITSRTEKPWIEKLDEALQPLLGLGAGSNLSFCARVWKTARRAGAVVGRKLKLLAPPPPPPSTPEQTPGIDYVDYQLNQPFSLSRQAADFGEVIPYCYLGVIELRHLSAPLNHEMLVMRKRERP